MAEPFAENRAADREWDAAKAPMIIAKKTAVATSKGRPVGRGPKNPATVLSPGKTGQAVVVKLA